MKMTAHLEECLDIIKTKFDTDTWFTYNDAPYHMPRRIYNLGRLAKLGKLESRVVGPSLTKLSTEYRLLEK